MNNNQMGMPPVAPAPRKNNTTLIIVIAVLVLCCCCVAIALPLAWSCGDPRTATSSWRPARP
jgi:hypothetical protein